MELDKLDQLAASVFEGYLVRKDLVRKYSRQYPVPTYVVEFMLGRYCASVDEQEECQKRASIWEILFTPPWRQNAGAHAGQAMQPFVVYTPGGSYTVTDSHHNLAAALALQDRHTEALVIVNRMFQDPFFEVSAKV